MSKNPPSLSQPMSVPAQRGRALALHFGQDKRGATAVEFAIVAVPFFTLLLAIFQLGLYFFYSEAVGAAVQDAARRIYTGQAQSANVLTSSTFISSYVCPQNGGTRLSSMIDCSKLFLDVRPAPTQGSFSGIDTAPDFYQTGASPKFCMGGPTDIVVVRLIYPMPVFAPGLSLPGTVNDVPNNAGTKQLILGTAVFQNEPFANGYQAPNGC